jgi:hypothetical protein
MRQPSAYRAAPHLVLVASLLVWLAACRYATTAPSTTDTTTTTTTTSTSATALTYTTDVAPILNSDCVRCHGGSNRQAGVDLSTYQNVMREVTAGNAGSILILVTQSGGLMFSQLSGNRLVKATTIHDWIVSSNAAQ